MGREHWSSPALALVFPPSTVELRVLGSAPTHVLEGRLGSDLGPITNWLQPEKVSGVTSDVLQEGRPAAGRFRLDWRWNTVLLNFKRPSFSERSTSSGPFPP